MEASCQLIRQAALCLAALCLLAACGSRETPAHGSAQPAAVTLAVARLHTVPVVEDIVGTVYAALRASVSAKVSASIESMNVVPGQMVTAGFVIATLNAREIQARRDQAMAARDQARQDYERFKKLLDQKVTSQYEYDTAFARFRTTQAALDEAETMMKYTHVFAPFDGVVTRKLADQGDLAVPGKPLVDMENPRSLRLEAEVPEAEVNRIRLGDRYRVVIDAATVRTNALVSEIAPSANPVSRTFLVKLDLPRVGELHAGQFGRVSIPVAETKALLVPAAAVATRGQLEFVFVVRDGVAVMRIVRTGKRTGDAVEILSGLSDGETIVTQDADRLRDGQPVKQRTTEK